MARVLLVDDEEDIVWGLSRVLSKAGYEVLTASNGREALELLKSQPVDVIVTDIKMPELSGLELISEAKKLYPQVAVIVMTARGSEEHMRESYDRGAVEYIEKPFDLDHFLELVGKAQREGFKGVVRDLKLVDILQILALEKSEAEIRVSAPGGSGRIFLADGKVVHSEFEGVEGEEAFFAILKLEGGSFSLRRGSKAPKRTINKDLDTLMLAAVAKMDEEQAAEAPEGPTIDVDSFSLTEMLQLEEPTQEAAPKVEVPDELREKLGEVLREALEGVRAEAEGIWLFGEGGALIARADSEASTPEVWKLLSAANAVGETSGKGMLQEVLLAFAGGPVIVRPLSGGRFGVVLLGKPKANAGLLRVSLLKLALRLEALLTNL